MANNTGKGKMYTSSYGPEINGVPVDEWRKMTDEKRDKVRADKAQDFIKKGK